MNTTQGGLRNTQRGWKAKGIPAFWLSSPSALWLMWRSVVRGLSVGKKSKLSEEKYVRTQSKTEKMILIVKSSSDEFILTFLLL